MDNQQPGEPSILGVDHVFEGLAHPRRRYLLYTLLEETERSLETIAARIAAWENDTAIDDLEADAIERVYISLYHNHVPKLVDDGMVVFEETSETISAGPNADQVLAVLENVGGSTESRLETHARSRQSGES